ncbi:MAG: GtrA family protein [Anaerolineae bacterium]|nr:GtrA family protein [Anaerolineae bacterium]MBL6965694.1 GtrA family protein [Anaerolineales bacterium]
MILTKSLSNPAERIRFLKFAIVGTIGAVVDFGVFNALTRFVAIDPVIASVCSFTVAIISNFTWNRFWTYPDSRSKSLVRQLSEFAVVNIVGVGIRTPVFAGLDTPLVDMFANLNLFPSATLLEPQFLGHNMALGIAVVLVMFWNYFVNRYWTYNDVE